MLRKEISDAIKYIGCDDEEIRVFEGQYEVPEGMTYNSYVILDEKIAVIDTVDERVTDEWIAKLEKELAGKTPDYLVINHMEPDHGGNVQYLANKYPSMQIVGNALTFKYTENFFEETFEDRRIVVKEGDTLSLGSHTLTFVMAPMVHWPEVMVAYESSEKVLFSADAFGKFGVYESEADDWACEARRYYLNIVGKYGVQVQTLLKKAAGLEINTICPTHGPILFENLGYHIGLYDTWSKYEPETKGVFICCGSLHGNTVKAGEYLKSVLEEKGVKVAFNDLRYDDIHEAVEDAFRYDRMVLMAPSYDGGLYPRMVNFLHILTEKCYQNRKVAIVENGTWAPCAGKKMKETVETFKNVEIVGDMITIKSTMKEADKKSLEALAEVLA